jgi:uncharacterized protein YcbK (DUF882 family)
MSQTLIFNGNNHRSLSRNLTSKECACPCCGYAIVNVDTVIAFEAIRKIVGKPLKVNSWYRCPKHNDTEKGAEYSKHLIGVAADLDWEGAETDLADTEFRNKIRAVNNVRGIGWGKGFMHVDTDEARPHLVEWRYYT